MLPPNPISPFPFFSLEFFPVPLSPALVTKYLKASLPLLLGALTLTAQAATNLHLQHVEFGRPIWCDSQCRVGVLFQDGGQSAAVPGGALWCFGDTFFGDPPVGDAPLVSQSRGAHWLTTALLPADRTNLPPALVYSTNAAGLALQPIDLLPGEDPKHTRLWPDGLTQLGSRTYLYYSVIKTTDAPGPWNFHGIGGGLAVATNSLGTFTRLQPGGAWKFPVEPAQVLAVGDWLYLFEISSAPKGLVLARVKAAEIENPSAYTFYNGTDWATNRADASAILRPAYGQVSLMWVPAWNEYLLATSSDFSHPHEIQFRTAPQPWGPWGKPAVRITVPEMPGQKTQVIYCTYLHPELSQPEANRFTCTYCRTLIGQWQLSNPEWLTVTFDR